MKKILLLICFCFIVGCVVTPAYVEPDYYPTYYPSYYPYWSYYHYYPYMYWAPSPELK